jgi:undecaprenyl diphosphate synthase
MLFSDRKSMPPLEGQEPAPPCHVAIIMDGNGRWAKKRWLPKIAGHRRGAEAVRTTVKACLEFNISYLTLYTFSSENWKRPADEVQDLMGLLRHYLESELAELDRSDVRIRFIGCREALAPDIVALIDKAEAQTQSNRSLHLVLAINYGGQAEIAEAARHLAEKVKKGEIQPEDINEDSFATHLQTSGIPDPDLIIRTSGEKRLSNFLLWQAAYAEFLFVDDLWPDFNRETLKRAIEEYHTRDRRFGATSG